MLRISAFLLFVLVSGSCHAQFLQGRVDNKNAKAIEGVNILNLSNGDYTQTNSTGYFVFQNAQLGDSIQFSFIGYDTRIIAVEVLGEPLVFVMKSNSISWDDILISSRVNALKVMTDINLQTSPVNSSQDMLRQVPGLFIGQHAGGGKAEQIFLRGFDLDHGTDIQITADGIPVNMVSHAHGQGYADLHFLIPETIDEIDLGKGPYDANKGNFATAAYVDFKTKESLENSYSKIEYGMFKARRIVNLFNLVNSEKTKAYFATEFNTFHGPFVSPQHRSRINIFGKITTRPTNRDKVGFMFSHFISDWDASGQIPQRAVDAGLISRFGAIDDTEGGKTSRTNLSLSYDKIINANSLIKNTLFYSRYNFELYSNFTFYRNNPQFGDQIRQKEERQILGINREYIRSFDTGTFSGKMVAGLSLRKDIIAGNELSRTRNRAETLEPIQLGDVNETNAGFHAAVFVDHGKWTLNPGARLDYFDFQYENQLKQTYDREVVTKILISPKLNVLYQSSENLQYYFKMGKGFHSNHASAVVARNGLDVIPAAYGSDLGLIAKPSSKMVVNMALWYLYSDQEFVFVGDEGVVEASGSSQRKGVDVSLRYQVLDYVFLNGDINYAHARSLQAPEGANFIPLAPNFTTSAGLDVRHPKGIFAGIKYRMIVDRPANEDNSIVAEGYHVFDANFGFTAYNIEFGIQVQNLFNVAWNETQFATKTRLDFEPEAVEEIHFTPGTPFFLKGT
ncbi:MAG: hypothetical protein ACJAY8_001565, partial [Sphingobacteriales bacterium]